MSSSKKIRLPSTHKFFCDFLPADAQMTVAAMVEVATAAGFTDWERIHRIVQLLIKEPDVYLWASNKVK